MAGIDGANIEGAESFENTGKLPGVGTTSSQYFQGCIPRKEEAFFPAIEAYGVTGMDRRVDNFHGTVADMQLLSILQTFVNTVTVAEGIHFRFIELLNRTEIARMVVVIMCQY